MANHGKLKALLAFTLVELLVVISIIGLLAAIVFASLNDTRIKSRDVRRIEDINQLQAALELYFHSYNKYPDNVSGLAALAPTYIPTIQKDPSRFTNYPYFALLGQSNKVSCGASQSCQYYHLGADLEMALPGGNNVLKQDIDLYSDATPTNNAPLGAPLLVNDFEGSSDSCETSGGGVEVARTFDGCYDVTP